MIKKYDAVEILPGFGLPGGGGFKWFAARDEDEDGLVKSQALDAELAIHLAVVPVAPARCTGRQPARRNFYMTRHLQRNLQRINKDFRHATPSY
jgi:hypothetical protein